MTCISLYCATRYLVFDNVSSFEVVALGSFNFQLTQNMSDFGSFHQMSVTSKYHEIPLQINKDIAFSVSTFPYLYRSNFTDEERHLTLILSCGNISNLYVEHLDERDSHVLTKRLLDSPKHSTATCFDPEDLTPLSNRRSNLWINVLRKSPILILIGPHMSLAEPMDLPLYLLKVLRLSYIPYENCHTFVANPPLSNFSWNFTMRNSLKILNKGAVLAAHRRCKLAANCPKWWRFISPYIGISNESICELRQDRSKYIVNHDSLPSLLEGRKLNSTASKILWLLKNQTVSNDIIKYAVSLLYEISLYDKQNEIHSSSSPNDYNRIDSGVILEQLNFMCCHWYHVDRLVNNMDETAFGNECHLDSLLTNVSYEDLKNSVLYNLGCTLNRTLEFHTLDSHLQPTLAWESGGYSDDSSWLGSNKWGAAIIDMQNENVYRLEEAATFQSLSRFIAGFHNSSLQPWLRNPKTNQHKLFNLSESTDSLVLDVKNPTHLTNLIDQPFISKMSRKNLVLLYYSSTCVYSFGGNSALWQFEAIARFFTSNRGLLFARVDVSKMDLPWHLRVENIPCIIFFPATRSSYSSVFPMEVMSATDLFPQLVSFIYEQINGDQKCEEEQLNRFQNSSQFAAKITSRLLNNIENKSAIQLVHLLHETGRICNIQPLSYSRTLCFSGIQKAIFIASYHYNEKQLSLSKTLNNLSNKLNLINDKLVESFSFLSYFSSFNRRNFLLLNSMHVYSKLWNIMSSQNSQIVNKLNVLSNYTHLQL
ncbi:Thioredoxin domain-containing protein 11 [Schistosoma japonicum]|nr:Thioredoxin domain-containing protein 11 [Schistosoma japonicum]